MDVATVIGALGAGESYENVEQNYALTREDENLGYPNNRFCRTSRVKP